MKGVIIINIKQEIGNSKALIKQYKEKLHHCQDYDTQREIAYLLNQETIRLESYELLLSHYERIHSKYE